MKTKEFTRRAIAALFAYGAFFGLFAYLVATQIDVFDVIDGYGPIMLGGMILLVSATVCCLMGINYKLFRLVSPGFSYSDAFQATLVNSIGNFLPLSAGMLAKGVLLKRKHRVDYSTYAALTAYTFALGVATSGAAGLISVVIVRPGSIMLLIGFTLMGLSSLIVFVKPRWLPLGRKSAVLVKSGRARQLFRSVQRPLALYYAVIVLLGGLRLVVAFCIIGHQVPYLHCVIFASGSVLTRLVTVTPGAIGVRETIVGTLAHLLGVDFQLTLLVVGIDRLSQIIGLFLLAAGRHVTLRLSTTWFTSIS